MLEQIIEAAVGFLVLLPLGTWLEKKLDREMEEDKAKAQKNKKKAKKAKKSKKAKK